MNKGIVELIFELKFTCQAKEESIREELRLSPSEYRGLLSISPGEIKSCMQMSNMMGLSKSRGSRVIDKLIDHGFLTEARGDEEDKRIYNVKLTLKGQNAIKRINAVMSECERAILKNVPADELQNFTKTLHKISEIITPA
ncbi:MAG TPA: MarR family winged helix-turn-helix transcriptional regulator [Ignavibacteria bacterium]|nr:MarR family winged helix-turn-helix transcriptional regulator [Ignavibacteria bacterium]HMQ99283.1 MarR family winged helix-turn-helix transcriptional regulator [Ignavibacteria bacterium]